MLFIFFFILTVVSPRFEMAGTGDVLSRQWMTDVVEISGSNFGNVRALVNVYFGDADAVIYCSIKALEHTRILVEPGPGST